MEFSTFLILLKIIMFLMTIIFLVFLFFISWSIYTLVKTQIPCVNTPKRNIKKIFEQLKFKKGSVLYDLGCGDGYVLFEAEKYGIKATGYELSMYPYLKCVLRKKYQKSNIVIKREDFLKQDLRDADIVFIFLTDVILGKVKEKLKKELKPGAIVVSYCFELSGWKKHKTLDTKPSKTHIYKIS